MSNQNNGIYPYCVKSTQYSVHSRRCFMTGELCSKQSSVHKERGQLHDKNHINAFVVMNFSDMSDVVYKWKLRSFVESLKKYLFLKKEPSGGHAEKRKTTAIACVANDKTVLPGNKEDWVQVEQINVVRADSNTESNYVICDRVCQQMQIADLVIVDVSVENTNVFYEFGMAAAFGKLILPICYNESFYQMHIPEAAKNLLEEERLRQTKRKYMEKDNDDENQKLERLRKMIEQHIDCYPWRRRLFEYYGLRYRKGNSNVGYTNFRDITNPVLGFSDIQYVRFPYDSMLDEVESIGTTKPDEDVNNNEDRKKVGFHLYNRLRASYNQKGVDDTTNKPSPFNTLVVYTMDSVLNEEQAGQCIINYYRNMTARIREEHCFCGDRVGVLGQSNNILDDPKDTKTDQKLMYKVSDIIRIGMNEATHMALQKKIKTDDYLMADLGNEQDGQWAKGALRFVKEHIRNRCIPAYPDEPIYVKQMEKGVQKGILDITDDPEKMHFFCLFHVMLHTLSYTNEIVVDLSQNSLQALFWLGVAHGSDVHAITVRHIPTEQELKRSREKDPPTERHIFDVAGLWTAILRTNDTDGFYRQLTKAQVGIEQSSKLVLPESEKYRDLVLEQYYTPSPYMKGGYSGFKTLLDHLDNTKTDTPCVKDSTQMLNLLQEIRENDRLCKIWETLTEQNQKESKQLESYYRTCFWRRMLRQNALKIYIPEKNGRTEEDDQPCRVNISWDVSATNELSHYLSKRLMIGSYRQTMLRDDSPQPDVWKQNFITIGNETKPFPPKKSGTNEPRRTLVDYARDQKTSGRVRKMMKYDITCSNAANVSKKKNIRGFFEEEAQNTAGSRDVFAWFPTKDCIGNIKKPPEGAPKAPPDGNKIYRSPMLPNAVSDCGCTGVRSVNGCYRQLAQMVLWREPADKKRNEMRFWVSLVGVSGPATLALTALLVNPDQRKELFMRNKTPDTDNQSFQNTAQHPLNKLQSEIRKVFLRKYHDLLKDKGLGDRLEKVHYATKLYLSTVLYQYFFPFLTRADEMRIKNGMEAFLVSNDQLFSRFESNAVLEALEDTMNTLQGVEAQYTVMVEYSGSDTDSRWPREIKPLENEVTCLFTDGQAGKNNT